MGGNALKQYGVQRVDPATYQRISQMVLQRLAPVCSRIEIPKELPGKEDFGDVDVLAVMKPQIYYLKNTITEIFHPRAIKQNGGVWSFNVENLQIDLITTSEDSFEIYYTYLCWGDLSMALGRVSRLYDLKYGIHGLEMPVRDPETNHVVETISISKDPRSIFEFLGYDYDVFERGFTTEEAVRDYLFSSPRIHQGFLAAASKNTKARKRDKLRPAFSRWLKYFEDHRDEFPVVATLPIPETLEDKIAYIEEAFPDSDLAYHHARVLQRAKNFAAARDKFSGKHIQEMFPELRDKDFGNLMKLWSNRFHTKDEQALFILEHSIEELEELVRYLRKNFDT